MAKEKTNEATQNSSSTPHQEPTSEKPSNYVDIHEINQFEQESLLAPIMGQKIEKFKAFCKRNLFMRIITGIPVRLWRAAHYPINKLNWLSLLAVLSLAIGITITTMSWKASRTRESGVGFEQFSIMNQLEQLKKTHEYYSKVATKEERLMRWVMAFSNWKYQRNGDPKYLQGDCVGAVYHYFQKWGSNFQLENVEWLINRTQNLASRGELKIRKNINEVQSGDIIILKLHEGNQHVGVVYTTRGNLIQYMDMNVATSMGIEKIAWGHQWIHSVVEVSYSLWIGNIMTSLNQ